MAGYTRFDVTDQIANGNTVDAIPLDGEFDAIQSAFAAVGGHRHNGTLGEGAPITVIGPAQDVVASGNSLTPKTDNTLDLGSSTLEWKDLWIDGTANIDSLVADTADINGGTIDATVIGATTPAAITGTTVTATDLVATTATVGGATVTTNSATQTLTNKTINLSNNTLIATSAQLAAAVTDETGSGALVFAASPALTGTPTAPTAPAGTNTTQLATTAHVFAERSNTATLTNKTLTSPTVNAPVISGGTVDNTVIGGTTPAAGTFSSLTATTAAINGGTITGGAITGGTINNTSIGATTRNTGAFTTLDANGNVILGDAAVDTVTVNGTATFTNGAVGVGGTAAASAQLDVQSTTKGFLPPRMTTTQRDAILSPANGLTIYNTTLNRMEIYSTAAAAWVAVGAGATGGGNDQIFWENGQTVTTNYTITDGKNAMSAGPITINSGITVTVGTGEVWTIV